MCPTSSVPASEYSSLLGNSTDELEHNFSCDGSRDDSSTEAEQPRQQEQKSKWYIILLGQSIALSLSCANAASSRLENKYIIIPTFQTGIVYIILSFHLVPLFWKERIKKQSINTGTSNDIYLISYGTKHSRSCDDKHSQDMYQLESKRQYTFPFTTLSLHTPCTTYILLSLLDIEANYFAMLSFQHTSLSSSIANSTMYGDLLALAAASLYGLNDVAAEYYVKANNDSSVCLNSLVASSALVFKFLYSRERRFGN